MKEQNPYSACLHLLFQIFQASTELHAVTTSKLETEEILKKEKEKINSLEQSLSKVKTELAEKVFLEKYL